MGAAWKDCDRRGTGLRVEGSFVLVCNEPVVYLGQNNQWSLSCTDIFEGINRKFSRWARNAMNRFGKTVSKDIYPKIIYANHQLIYTIVDMILSFKKNDFGLTFGQKELVSHLERLMLFNITGDLRAIGDHSFKELGIRPYLHYFGIEKRVRVINAEFVEFRPTIYA